MRHAERMPLGVMLAAPAARNTAVDPVVRFQNQRHVGSPVRFAGQPMERISPEVWADLVARGLVEEFEVDGRPTGAAKDAEEMVLALMMEG